MRRAEPPVAGHLERGDGEYVLVGHGQNGISSSATGAGWVAVVPPLAAR